MSLSLATLNELDSPVVHDMVWPSCLEANTAVCTMMGEMVRREMNSSTHVLSLVKSCQCGVFFRHVINNMGSRWLLWFQPLLSLVFVSLLVSSLLVRKCVRSGGGGWSFSSPRKQGCACCLWHFFSQIKSFCNYWSGEAVGAAGRVKDSVIRH